MSGTATAPGQGRTAPLPALGGTPDLSEVRDWIALLKPRVMSLVVFAGLVVPGNDPVTMLALAATFLELPSSLERVKPFAIAVLALMVGLLVWLLRHRGSSQHERTAYQ